MSEKLSDDKTLPLRVRICMLLGIDPIDPAYTSEVLYLAISQKVDEAAALRVRVAELEAALKILADAEAAYRLAPNDSVSQTAWDAMRLAGDKASDLLCAPPALSPYAARQVAEAEQHKNDERQGKQ